MICSSCCYIPSMILLTICIICFNNCCHAPSMIFSSCCYIPSMQMQIIAMICFNNCCLAPSMICFNHCCHIPFNDFFKQLLHVWPGWLRLIVILTEIVPSMQCNAMQCNAMLPHSFQWFVLNILRQFRLTSIIVATFFSIICFNHTETDEASLKKCSIICSLLRRGVYWLYWVASLGMD